MSAYLNRLTLKVVDSKKSMTAGRWSSLGTTTKKFYLQSWNRRQAWPRSGEANSPYLHFRTNPY